MVRVCFAVILLYLYIILFCFLAKMLKRWTCPNNLSQLFSRQAFPDIPYRGIKFSLPELPKKTIQIRRFLVY